MLAAILTGACLAIWPIHGDIMLTMTLVHQLIESLDSYNDKLRSGCRMVSHTPSITDLSGVGARP